MRCWILYDAADLEENRFFADRLKKYADQAGFETEIVTTGNFDIYDPADVVISRARQCEFTFRLEDNGATVFNRSSVSRVCNDKAYTYSFVRSLGIPILPFSFPGDGMPPGPPWVIKSRTGHGGSEVFKVDSVQEAYEMIIRIGNDKPIIQQFCKDPGRDLRVYVLGGKIIAAVMRSSDKDFRANFKLGGNAEIVEVPEDIKKMVKTIVPELMPDFVGIDFIFSDGKPYLNEIEDVVGTRMLYKLTDLDPAKMYIEYIADRVGQY